MHKKAGRWHRPKKVVESQKAAAAPAPVVKQIGGEKNNGQRTILPKGPKFYAAEDVPKPLSKIRAVRPTRLRSSITPGTVLILLAGRFRGRRVVFLKQLPSGLLLITGPYRINGVPIRRVNQAYVIATSTKVDVSGVPSLDKFTDAFFKKPAKAVSKKSEEEFFASEEKKKEVAPDRKDDQKLVDESLLAAIKKEPTLRQYLGARFSLRKGQKPHEMKF